MKVKLLSYRQTANSWGFCHIIRSWAALALSFAVEKKI